jgi:hypothetical protein
MIIPRSDNGWLRAVAKAVGLVQFEGNIQLLCPSCNCSKHAKDPIVWALELGLLI